MTHPCTHNTFKKDLKHHFTQVKDWSSTVSTSHFHDILEWLIEYNPYLWLFHCIFSDKSVPNYRCGQPLTVLNFTCAFKLHPDNVEHTSHLERIHHFFDNIQSIMSEHIQYHWQNSVKSLTSHTQVTSNKHNKEENHMFKSLINVPWREFVNVQTRETHINLLKLCQYDSVRNTLVPRSPLSILNQHYDIGTNNPMNDCSEKTMNWKRQCYHQLSKDTIMSTINIHHIKHWIRHHGNLDVIMSYMSSNTIWNQTHQIDNGLLDKCMPHLPICSICQECIFFIPSVLKPCTCKSMNQNHIDTCTQMRNTDTSHIQTKIDMHYFLDNLKKILTYCYDQTQHSFDDNNTSTHTNTLNDNVTSTNTKTLDDNNDSQINNSKESTPCSLPALTHFFPFHIINLPCKSSSCSRRYPHSSLEHNINAPSMQFVPPRTCSRVTSTFPTWNHLLHETLMFTSGCRINPYNMYDQDRKEFLFDCHDDSTYHSSPSTKINQKYSRLHYLHMLQYFILNRHVSSYPQKKNAHDDLSTRSSNYSNNTLFSNNAQPSNTKSGTTHKSDHVCEEFSSHFPDYIKYASREDMAYLMSHATQINQEFMENGHVFHYECIINWFNVHWDECKCPNCNCYFYDQIYQSRYAPDLNTTQQN